jgi:hypothetical protein
MPDFQEYDELFRIIVSSEKPPHQIIVALFVKFLQWEPLEIATELSSCSLSDFVDKIEGESVKAGLSRVYVRSRLRDLRDRITHPVGEVLSEDSNTRKAYRVLLELPDGRATEFARIPAGQARLEEFYRRKLLADRADEISKWCDAVRRHAFKSSVDGNLIRHVCSSSPAHWDVSFIYIRLLGWQPERFVKHRSCSRLIDLAQQAVKDFADVKKVPESVVRVWADGLWQHMDQTVAQSLGPSFDWLMVHKAPVDDSLRKQFAVPFNAPEQLSDCQVCETHLEHYYTLDDRDLQVVFWCMAAAERALAVQQQA